MYGKPKLSFEIVGTILVKAVISVSHHPMSYFHLWLILSDFTNLTHNGEEIYLQASQYIICSSLFKSLIKKSFVMPGLIFLQDILPQSGSL